MVLCEASMAKRPAIAPGEKHKTQYTCGIGFHLPHEDDV